MSEHTNVLERFPLGGTAEMQAAAARGRGRPAEAPGRDEEEEPGSAYATVRNRDRAEMVEFRLLPARAGQHPDRAEADAFDYAWLPRLQWRPGADRAAAEIVLPSSLGVTITIRGRNLEDLKEKLRRKMVTWVQEQGDNPLVLAERGALPTVFSIRIEPTRQLVAEG